MAWEADRHGVQTRWRGRQSSPGPARPLPQGQLLRLGNGVKAWSVLQQPPAPSPPVTPLLFPGPQTPASGRLVLETFPPQLPRPLTTVPRQRWWRLLIPISPLRSRLISLTAGGQGSG